MNNPYAPPPAGGFGGSGGFDTSSYRPEEPAAQATFASVESLRQTKPWVMFLSVMGFIGSGFALLAAVFMMIAGAFAPSSAATPFPPALLGLVYVPFAFIYIYPSLKLWSFGSAIGRLVQTRSSADLEAALVHQKSFWKFVGILMILMLVMEVLVVMGAMVGGFMAAAGGHH